MKDKEKDYTYLVAMTGRPTKFRKEFITEMVKFFNIEPTRKEIMETVTEYNKDGVPRKTAEKWKHVPNKLPTLVQFAKHIKVSYASLVRWAENGDDPMLHEKLAKNEGLSVKEVQTMKDIQQFCKTYKQAKALQQDFLMQNGLIGSSPAAAYIFTAKNITGMRDKVEQDVTMRQVRPLLENLKPNGVHNNNSDEENSGS